ncbi:MAG: helix-turn-helix transcriptional regulator [Patescibacteria group bacterium]
MTNIFATRSHDQENSDEIDTSPLGFHIRRLRQWYGEGGLSQRELADLADVSPRQLRMYESCRMLPEPISFLLSLALALRVPLESLINETVVNRLRAEIERRRPFVEQGARQRALDLPSRGYGA